jgi:hypothetical protein
VLETAETPTASGHIVLGFRRVLAGCGDQRSGAGATTLVVEFQPGARATGSVDMSGDRLKGKRAGSAIAQYVNDLGSLRKSMQVAHLLSLSTD